MIRPVEVTWLGRVPYMETWEEQQRLAAAVAARESNDRLLLLEHPPVYTLGRSGHEENLLWDEARRAREGITVHRVDRGGDVTYHGPGQLVGYPILDLRAMAAEGGRAFPDLHRYLRDLEEVLIRALAEMGVAGRRYEGYTGVWVEAAGKPRKIAAIGVKVSSRGVSSHGFAINVAPDLGHFSGIVPCGIAEYEVTSLAALLGQTLAVSALVAPVIAAFCAIFQRELLVVAGPLSAYNPTGQL